MSRVYTAIYSYGTVKGCASLINETVMSFTRSPFSNELDVEQVLTRASHISTLYLQSAALNKKAISSSCPVLKVNAIARERAYQRVSIQLIRYRCSQKDIVDNLSSLDW